MSTTAPSPTTTSFSSPPAASVASPAGRLSGLIRQRMDELQMSEADLAEELGFTRPAPLAMILDGKTRLPWTMIPELAHALCLDVMHVARLSLQESSPELLELLEVALERPLLSANEAAVVDAFRKACRDQDVRGVVVRRAEVVDILAMPSNQP